MKYSIVIDYTGNDEKAGKLSVVGEDGNIVLNKVAVAVPSSIVEKGEQASQQYLTLETKDTTRKVQLLGNYEYEEVSKRFQLMGLKSVIMASSGLAIIPNIPLGNNKENLNSTKDAFVMHENDYLKLEKISNGKSFDFSTSRNEFEITISKRIFLWFPEKVNNTKSHVSITAAIYDLDKKQSLAEIAVSVNGRKTVKTEAPKTDFKTAKPPETKKGFKSDTHSKVEEILTSGKTNAQNSKANDEKRKNEQRLREESLARSRAEEDERRRRDEEYRRNDNLDALDIMLMYNNPELAPIFKPNSMLAWALYFNSHDKEVSNSSVKDAINTVPGFEAVEHSEVKYTTSGYSVAMYEDEQKTKLIGTLVHDAGNNSYTMESSEGTKTTSMSFDDNGDAKGSVFGEKGTTNFDLIQNPSGGYSGNWESESSEGIKISSGVSFDDSLTSTSTPFEPVNMDSAITSRDTYRETMKYESDAAPKWEPPPPPPPPPPQDDMRWSSSNDSYSNGASFSM